MRVLKLEKKNTERLYDVLAKFGEIWSPVEKDESYRYEKIDNAADLTFHHHPSRTILPEKKLLMPPKFPTLKFTSKGYTKPDEEIPTKVIFGVKSCGVHAINILDKFYTTDYVDADYKIRREKLIIVATSCLPDENCFCNKTNTSIVQEGFDLGLVDLDDYFLVWIGTSIGDDIVRLGERMGIFDENVPKDIVEKYTKFRKDKREAFTNDIDLEGLTDLMELSHNAEFWKELGDKCLACGHKIEY